VIFGVMVLTLASVFQLSRLASRWHYIVPADEGELLYATSFDGPMPDWNQDRREMFAHVVEGGVMRISASGNNERPFSAADPYFADFDVQVDVYVAEGEFTGASNNAYGLVFRQIDTDNYYVFLVSGDGFYRVLRFTDGESIELSTWLESDAINLGIDVTNRLRVMGYEDTFQFFVNGQQLDLCVAVDDGTFSTVNPLTGECLVQWTDTLVDGSHPFGRIAVAVDGDRAGERDLVIEFDNLIIYSSEPIE
jgi:hypothetical protein